MRSLFRKIREANRPFCTALVAAAGSSSRMGGTDKLMEFLDNVPVLMRTLTALQRAAAIDEIVIAAHTAGAACRRHQRRAEWPVGLSYFPKQGTHDPLTSFCLCFS